MLYKFYITSYYWFTGVNGTGNYIYYNYDVNQVYQVVM